MDLSKPVYLLELKKRRDPSAVVYDEIIKNLGTSIRPDFENTRFNITNQTYNIPLHAFIPNELNPIGKSIKFRKKFIYRIYNVGEVSLKQIKDERNAFKIASITSADEIDGKLFKEFWDLRKEVTDHIMNYGREKWGKLTYIRNFLSPYYRILNALIYYEEFHLQYLESKDQMNWLSPLYNLKYIKIDPDRPSWIIPTNKLYALQDEHQESLSKVPEIVVGNIIAEYLHYVVEKLNIRSIVKYFDLANLYYIMALDYGELISISRKEFIRKFIKFGRRPTAYGQEANTLIHIAELTNIQMLEKGEENAITGKADLFEEIFTYRDKSMTAIEEIAY